MCLYPRIIKNRKYTSTKKNKGVVPELKDSRTQYLPIGCGKCYECRKQRANSWKVRLMEEIKLQNTAYFVTLTFNTEAYIKLYNECKHKKLSAYDIDNKIATRAIKLWRERWRKHHKRTPRYWLVTELGHENTEHIHLHGVIWTELESKEIETKWANGFTWIGDKPQNYVNDRTINYITKYILKVDVKHTEYNPIVLCSKGIGSNYLDGINVKNNKYNGDKTIDTYRTRQGYKILMPTYYKQKIYNDNEKEKLWLAKLDKGIRYVKGEKIEAHNDKMYEETIKYYQVWNTRIGYPDGKVNWDRREYENEMRLQKHVERGAITEEDKHRKMEQFKRYRQKEEAKSSI